MNKLSKITLVFENTEFMEIPIDKVLYWNIHDVTKDISSFNGSDEVYKYNKCKRFDICIDKTFLDSDFYNEFFCKPGEKRTYRDRLNVSDIVDVELEYMDGTKKSYEVPWNDACNYVNSYQHWDNNAIVICDNDEWKRYKELSEYVDYNVPDVEPEELPDKICDVCGKSENCCSIRLVEPDGEIYKDWTLCNKCAKSVWEGIRSSIIGDVLNRHSFVENEATTLKFLFDNGMLHTVSIEQDWLDGRVQLAFGMDMSKIMNRVYEIIGK